MLRTVLGTAELRSATARPEPIVRRNVTLSPRNGTPAVLVERHPAAHGDNRLSRSTSMSIG